MNSFDWDRHEARPITHPDGARRPLWMRWLWAPGVVWFLGTLYWGLTVKGVPHVDDYVLNALSFAALGVVAWAALSLLHLRVHRPDGFASVITGVNIFVAVFIADKAIHAAVRHYGLRDED